MPRTAHTNMSDLTCPARPRPKVRVGERAGTTGGLTMVMGKANGETFPVKDGTIIGIIGITMIMAKERGGITIGTKMEKAQKVDKKDTEKEKAGLTIRMVKEKVRVVVARPARGIHLPPQSVARVVQRMVGLANTTGRLASSIPNWEENIEGAK